MDVPVYRLGQQFKVYNLEGALPGMDDLLIPHRKDHYLIVFIKKASTQQWIDMQPYRLKDNTVYFCGPNQVIVKEEPTQLWSTGIAFTPEFLSLQGSTSFPLGYTATDFNHHSGPGTIPDAAARVVKAATFGADGPTGQFFSDDNNDKTGISEW